MAGNGTDGRIYTCVRPPPPMPPDAPEMRAWDPAADRAAQEAQQRAANSIGIALLGPIFGGPAAGARLAGAPEETVGLLSEIGLNTASAVSLKRTGGGGKVAEPPIFGEPATTVLRAGYTPVATGKTKPSLPMATTGSAGAGADGIVVAKKSIVRIGRWMSSKQYEDMKRTGKVQNGAGDAAYGTTSGPESFGKQAPPGSIYAEYDVPANSVLKGSKPDWVMTIGPGANNMQKAILIKQGGEFSPPAKNISEILGASK